MDIPVWTKLKELIRKFDNRKRVPRKNSDVDSFESNNNVGFDGKERVKPVEE